MELLGAKATSVEACRRSSARGPAGPEPAAPVRTVCIGAVCSDMGRERMLAPEHWRKVLLEHEHEEELRRFVFLGGPSDRPAAERILSGGPRSVAAPRVREPLRRAVAAPEPLGARGRRRVLGNRLGLAPLCPATALAVPVFLGPHASRHQAQADAGTRRAGHVSEGSVFPVHPPGRATAVPRQQRLHPEPVREHVGRGVGVVLDRGSLSDRTRLVAVLAALLLAAWVVAGPVQEARRSGIGSHQSRSVLRVERDPRSAGVSRARVDLARGAPGDDVRRPLPRDRRSPQIRRGESRRHPLSAGCDVADGPHEDGLRPASRLVPADAADRARRPRRRRAGAGADRCARSGTGPRGCARCVRSASLLEHDAWAPLPGIRAGAAVDPAGCAAVPVCGRSPTRIPRPRARERPRLLPGLALLRLLLPRRARPPAHRRAVLGPARARDAPEALPPRPRERRRIHPGARAPAFSR